jgi:hypothetical protein
MRYFQSTTQTNGIAVENTDQVQPASEHTLNDLIVQGWQRAVAERS